MKKLVLLASLGVLSTASALAQKNNVRDAESIIESEKPKWEEARALIRQAETNPETQNDAKTWFVAGKLEDRYFNNQIDEQQHGRAAASNDKIYQAVIDSYIAYLKADSLDALPNAKGKVKRRYQKDIEKRMGINMTNLRNAGAIFFDAKNYKKATEAWTIYLYLQTSDLLKNTKQQELKADAIDVYAKIAFYAGIAAERMHDEKLAERFFETALKCETSIDLEVYKHLANLYRERKDIEKLQSVVKVALQKYPKETAFQGIMIDYYASNNQPQKAIDMIEQAIVNDPQNVILYVVKGQLYEKLGKVEDALNSLKKAISIDANNYDANYNLGRLYYNLSVDEKVKKKSDAYQQSALPYLEKAYQLNSEGDAKALLRNVYYQLNMNAEYNKLMKK